MIVTITVKWKRRTKPNTTANNASDPERDHREWITTRGIILRVLDHFPDTLNAVRQALIEHDEQWQRQTRGPHGTG